MIRAWLVPAGLLGFLGVLIIYPMLLLFARGIGFDILQSAYIFERLLQTLVQATLSSLLVFGLSLFCGTLLGRYRFWGKAMLEAWLGVPFVVPVMVAGLGFLALFGARGFIQLEGTLILVLLANLFYNLGTAVRLTMNAPYNPELEMVARLEGANSWQVWRMVSLPVALPFALVGAGFAFLYSFASFAVPLLLGGNQFATLEVEMYQAVQRLELENASALALVQASLMLFFGWVVLQLERVTSQPALWQQQKPSTRGTTRFLLGFVVIGLLVLTTLPLLAVLWRSLSSTDGLTLRHYIKLLENTDILVLAIGNNIGFAAGTLTLVVPLGVMFANYIWQRDNKIFDLFSLLPLAVSSTVLGVGLIVAYPFWAAQLPLLIAVYTLQALPLVTRAMLLGLRQLETSLLEAASLDGAGTWARWRFIILPLTQVHLRGGVGLGFAVVVGEFAATLMLTRPEWTTLSTLIYQRLSRPNQLGEACALAVILLLLTMLGFLAILRSKTQPHSL